MKFKFNANFFIIVELRWSFRLNIVKLWVDCIEMKRAFHLGFYNYLDQLGNRELKLQFHMHVNPIMFWPTQINLSLPYGATMVNMPWEPLHIDLKTLIALQKKKKEKENWWNFEESCAYLYFD